MNNLSEIDRHKLIESQMALVRFIANKFSATPRVSYEDLLSDGYFGLVKAANHFDPTRGFKFCTYAYWCIYRAMQATYAKDKAQFHKMVRHNIEPFIKYDDGIRRGSLASNRNIKGDITDRIVTKLTVTKAEDAPELQEYFRFLTDKQKRLIQDLSTGKTQKEIARSYGVSSQSVSEMY